MILYFFKGISEYKMYFFQWFPGGDLYFFIIILFSIPYSVRTDYLGILVSPVMTYSMFL